MPVNLTGDFLGLGAFSFSSFLSLDYDLGESSFLFMKSTTSSGSESSDTSISYFKLICELLFSLSMSATLGADSTDARIVSFYDLTGSAPLATSNSFYSSLISSSCSLILSSKRRFSKVLACSCFYADALACSFFSHSYRASSSESFNFKPSKACYSNSDTLPLCCSNASCNYSYAFNFSFNYPT